MASLTKHALWALNYSRNRNTGISLWQVAKCTVISKFHSTPGMFGSNRTFDGSTRFNSKDCVCSVRSPRCKCKGPTLLFRTIGYVLWTMSQSQSRALRVFIHSKIRAHFILETLGINHSFLTVTTLPSPPIHEPDLYSAPLRFLDCSLPRKVFTLLPFFFMTHQYIGHASPSV